MSIARLLLFAALLAGCSPSPAPPPVVRVAVDESAQPWYRESVSQLQSINTQARQFVKLGQTDQASDLIQTGEAMIPRLLSVSHPTLAAMEAASDLDDLYGRMFLTNHHWGWARLMFQKNASRWKTWRPQTEETARRLKEAQDAIAECDRHID